jgi:20S proteasome subunit beta 7
LFNNSIMGGVTKDGEKYLAVIDMLGNTYEGNHLVTGLAHYFNNVLFANKWRPDISESEARSLIEECLRVLFYRDCKASDRIQITKITKEGVTLEEPYQLTSEWDLEGFKHDNINEHTRDMKHFFYQK